MRNIAQQCAGYGEKHQCPTGFNAVLLRDVADTFDEQTLEDERGCE